MLKNGNLIPCGMVGRIKARVCPEVGQTLVVSYAVLKSFYFFFLLALPFQAYITRATAITA